MNERRYGLSRWMIASDLHGSEYYLDKMMKAMETEKADKLLFLGDLLYHGPRNDLPKDYNPKSVATKLNEIKDRIFCVRGNCDADVDQMMVEFPVLSEYAFLEVEGVSIYASHGHVFNPGKLPPLPKGTVFLYGHTHVPECVLLEGRRVLNPGSLSIPKKDSWHGYMILEKGVFIWKDLESGEEKMRCAYEGN